MAKNKKKIQSLDDLTPDPANVNKGSERGHFQLDWSLTELGAGRSILADADGVVLAGNKTLEVAADHGLPVRVVETDGKELVVVQRTDLRLQGEGAERTKARQLAIADNRVSETSYTVDVETLLAHAQTVDISALYRQDEIDALLASLEPELPAPGGGGDEFDATPEEAQTRVRRGDLWELGNHRLLCGDSTKAEDVARVMGGEKADAVFTSPPYDQQRTYEGNMASDWRTLVSSVVLEAFSVLSDQGQVFINLGLVHKDGQVIRYWDGMIQDVESAGWPLFGWYVWDKLDAMPGDWAGRLAPAHEWIFHFIKSKVKPEKTVPTKHAGKHVGSTQRNADGTLKEFTQAGAAIQSHKIPDSVIRIAPQKPDELINKHPAPFPVGLPLVFIEAWAHAEVWFEPFGGSGTTLIACERTNRKARVIEIEPKYCNVILSRWEAETGREAKLLERTDAK